MIQLVELQQFVTQVIRDSFLWTCILQVKHELEILVEVVTHGALVSIVQDNACHQVDKRRHKNARCKRNMHSCRLNVQPFAEGSFDYEVFDCFQVDVGTNQFLLRDVHLGVLARAVVVGAAFVELAHVFGD